MLRERCGRTEPIMHSLHEEYGQARITLMWSNRMMEQRMAAGEQIFQTAELLRQVASGFSNSPEQEQRIGKRLRRELKYLSVEVEWGPVPEHARRVKRSLNFWNSFWMLDFRRRQRCG